MSMAGPVENIVDCSSALEAIDTLCLRAPAVQGAGSGACSQIPSSEVPEPFGRLLVHAGQMSEALQRYYEAPLELHVMSTYVRGDDYSRKVFLTVECRDRIIGYGLIHVRLQHLPDDVAKQIKQGVHPLGLILVRHKIVRSIEPEWYIRLERGSGYLRGFGTRLASPAYGRVGMVYCNNEPAVEFLEVVIGIDPADARTPVARNDTAIGNRRL